MAEKLRPYSATEEKVGNVVVKWMSRLNTWLFRLSGGRLGNKFLYGAPVLLLVTKGRKSGAPRTAPLLYLQDGNRYVIVASKGGMSQHPLWYRNLQADPNVEIEIGGERLPMHAQTASAAEKKKLWPRLVEMYPPYESYQARTDRKIPVVILVRR